MWNDVDQRIRRAFSNVRQGFRAVLTRVDSSGDVQTVQADALAGEQLQDAELFQHYGYSANPPPGSMAVVLPLGGRSSHGVVIATEHGNYRLKQLKPGEVALYSDEGSKIVLKRGRLIEVECDTFSLRCKNWQVNASEQASFTTPRSAPARSWWGTRSKAIAAWPSRAASPSAATWWPAARAWWATSIAACMVRPVHLCNTSFSPTTPLISRC